MTISEIDHRIAEAFENAIDPESGEIIDEAAWKYLEELQLEREAKLEGVACWYKELQAEAAAIKAEEENLKKRRQSAENKATSIKKFLEYLLNGQKFKSPKVALSWRKSEVVELKPDMDPATLPLAFQAIKVTVSPDKVKLKEALKAGAVIEGVELVEKQNLQVK